MKVLKTIFSNTKPILIILSILLCIGCSIMEVFEIRYLGTMKTINMHFIYGYICIAVILTMSNFAGNILASCTRNSLYDTMTRKYVNKLMHLDNDFFKEYHSGEILNNINSIGGITDILTVINKLVISISMLVSSMYYLKSSKLTWVICILFPIVFVAMNKLNSIQKATKLKRHSLQKERLVKTNDAILGHKLVMDCNNIDTELQNIDISNDAILKLSNYNCVVNSGFHIVISLLQYSLITIILLISFIDNASSSATYTNILLIGKLINPLLMLMTIIEPIQEALVGYAKFETMMNMEVEKTGDCKLDKFHKSIKIKDLSFKYEDDSQYVLNGLNLTINKGQTIGICGPSGCGKSTLLSILQKHNKNFEGTITIDDINIHDIENSSLRNTIGVVNQDTYILSNNIMENIRYARMDATDEEVIEAAKKANIHNFIVWDLKDGYYSNIGPNGIKLSGGQRQRLAIARIFLKNPDIILFDEATSALDNNSERIISESIDKLSSDKTVIIIAHRLSTIRNCDNIIVMDKNKIVEYGDHNSLLNNNGLYSQMLNG